VALTEGQNAVIVKSSLEILHKSGRLGKTQFVVVQPGYQIKSQPKSFSPISISLRQNPKHLSLPMMCSQMQHLKRVPPRERRKQLTTSDNGAGLYESAVRTVAITQSRQLIDSSLD